MSGHVHIYVFINVCDMTVHVSETEFLLPVAQARLLVLVEGGGLVRREGFVMPVTDIRHQGL